MDKCVMIVEDELFVALAVGDTAEEVGLTVDGPYSTVSEALKALEKARPDCAVLDVRLRDGEVYQVADTLHQMGVPIIFHSGHADEGELLAKYPRAVICGKPCSPSLLKRELERASAGVVEKAG